MVPKEQCVHRFLIGGRERKAVQLVEGCPCHIVDGERPWFNFTKLASVQHQLDDIVLVLASGDRHALAGIGHDAEPAEELPNQRRLVALASFDPPSWKLPQQRENRVLATLGDQIAAVALDGGADDPDRCFRHKFPFFSAVSFPSTRPRHIAKHVGPKARASSHEN